MNKNIFLSAILGIAIFASCKKTNNQIDYTPSIKIQFSEGGDSSIVTVQKGTMTYPMQIDIKGSGSVIRKFELYNADTKTGNRGTLIDGTSVTFSDPVENHAATYSVPALTENRCIKVVVTDNQERVFEKNLLVRITPAVLFSDVVKMETVESYYGPYLATWLSGRVYMRDTKYAREIDLSIGEVIIPSGSASTVPALVNPAQRKAFNLLTAEGLQSTKYELTNLTAAQYTGVSRVDASAITALTDPTQDVVALQAGKVYVFKTAGGKKGLVHIASLTAKSGAFEKPDGQWTQAGSYFELALSAKTVAP